MKKFVTVICAFALFVTTSGCGAPKGDAELKEMLKLTKEAKDLKDPAKALEMMPKMMAVAKKLEDLKLTDDEAKKLFEANKKELEALGVKDHKEMMKNK